MRGTSASPVIRSGSRMRIARRGSGAGRSGLTSPVLCRGHPVWEFWTVWWSCFEQPMLATGATARDFPFLAKPERPLFVGYLRSGSKVLDVPVYLDAKQTFTHHILVPATTGRGKSNLVKVLLYSSLERSDAGVLILDPHDEYY